MGGSEKRRSSVTSDRMLARAAISDLVKKGIKLLALDFDRTIVSIHTAGSWRQGTPKLAEHVRPCFQSLIKAALECPDIHVCIVTYSMQPGLILDVLKTVLPKSDVENVMLRANTKDWLQQQSGPPLGKQQHIAWIVTELFHRKRVIIQSHEILLMDDDVDNVQVAIQFGHQAFEVREDVTLDNIKDYVDKLELHKYAAIPVS